MAAKKAKKRTKKAARAKKAPARKAKKAAKTGKTRKKKASAKKAVKAATRTTKAKRAQAKRAPAKKARKALAKKKQIVGEGDYAASESFNKQESSFVRKNKAKIPDMGKAAEKALEGPEGDALREAEATAADRSRDIF